MRVLYRRQRQQYLFAALLGVIGVINLLFFVILYRPARSEYFQLQESIEKLRSEIQSRQRSVARLEKLNAQLETSEQDRHRLFTSHFIPRDVGWSEILPQLDEMTNHAGVRSLRKNYAIDEAPQYGLYSVRIVIPVSATYSNIVNFIKDIETSDTFFIIDSIDIRGSTSETPGVGDIALALNLETFFYK